MNFFITRMKILFWHRRDNVNKRGEASIQCRITLNGKRCPSFSTNVFCKIGDYDPIKREIKGDELGTLELESIRNKIKMLHMTLEASGKPLTALIVRDIYLGKKVLEITLDYLLTKYLENRFKMTLPNKKGKILLTKDTYKADEYFANNIRLFLKDRKLGQITPKEVTPKIALDFYYWLQSAKDAGQDYAVKKAHQLSALIDYAVVEEFAPANPLTSIKWKKGKKEDPISLEPHQVEELWNYNFENANLRKVADYALLQCYTSLAYSDLKCFNPFKDIDVDEYGEWVNKNRKKSGTKSLLRLLPRAKEIIEKYTKIEDGTPVFTLKVMSNSDYNKYLKVIEAMFNFKVPFKTHLFRRTYGCLRLHDGCDIFRLSKEMGHKNVQETIDNYAVLLRKLEMSK